MRFEFQYNDKIVNHLLKIENIRTQLSLLDLSTDIKYKLSQNTKTNEIFYLANSLGIEFTLKDAEKVITGINIDTHEDSRIQMVENFKDVLEFNRSSLIDTHGEADLNLLVKLNKICGDNIYSPADMKIRDGNDNIQSKNDNWTLLRDKSLQNPEIHQLMEELISWFKDLAPYMNNLVRNLIFIFNLIDICPFVSSNKLTILAFADLMMLKNNLSTKSFTSTNFVFLQNEDKLIQTFAIAKTNRDSTLWVQEVLGLIVKSLQKTQEELQSYIIEEEKSKKQPFLDLNKRQLKILRYLQNVPNIKREDYCHMMEVSSMTAFRDLDDLVRKKLLKLEGKGRGTKYRLASM